MDSYTTSYYTSVVSYIQADFGMDDSTFYRVQAIAALGLLFVLGIQYLADVVGRKPMMIIVFFGMGFAALILLIAQTTAVFTIGFFLSWVFFSSDIWVIIVSEEAPAKKRGTYSYLIAVVGALGAIAIPVCRSIFVKVGPEVDPSAWRGMNYLAIVAMLLALLGFWMKETSAFREKKKLDASESKQDKIAKFGVPFQTKYRKTTIIFVIIGFMLGLTAAVISTLEVYITTTIVTENSGDSSIVTNIIYIATLGTFVFFGITGLLADKLGRKMVIFIYSLLFVGSFAALAFFGGQAASNQNYLLFYLAGFLANGSFWGIFMLSKTYCVECFPTGIRGTAAGWRSFSYAIGLILGSLISSYLILVLSREMMFFVVSLITGIIISILVAKGLPEMKGVNIIE